MRRKAEPFSLEDEEFMRRALVLAARGYGSTSPNPMVGAVVVRNREIIGEGWHKRAGEAHAEVNAINAAERKGYDVRGASIYVTLEPCSTSGRTPPCTDLLQMRGIARVIIGARDPNPKHNGAGFKLLRKTGIKVEHGLLRAECERLNEVFNHWIAQRTPFVIMKSAMSLDGKIGTNSGESKWITGEKARQHSMRLRLGVDAVLCGINTVLRDDPSLTIRRVPGVKILAGKRYSRIIVDREARIPLTAKVVSDEEAGRTIVVVSSSASEERIRELEKRVRTLTVPTLRDGRAFKLDHLLRQLAAEEISSVLVEGGGETHAAFLAQKLVQRIYFFYAPVIITGRSAPKSVAGPATVNSGRGFRLRDPEWIAVGRDLLLTGAISY